MAITNINKDFRFKGKDIKYLNKDFAQFRDGLIEFTKTYFPKTYSDFNETSPGMLFIELASYIGDSLSYYIDDTLKESLMVHAEDINSVISLAQYLGYKPKVTSPSVVTVSVYQLVPALQNGEIDEKFLLRVKEGMLLDSDDGIPFITRDVVDFTDDRDREITLYQVDESNNPEFYLVKKQVKAISGELKTATFTYGSYEPFRTANLGRTDVIEIIDVRDADGRKYYEVPYLGQEMVFIDYPNVEENEPELYQFKDTVPYILKSIKTPKRFVHRINPDRTSTIQFGIADPTSNDELVVPNLKNIGLGLPNSISRLDTSFDPTNFLQTRTYGVSPANTTITVKYIVGGGVETNVRKGTINKVRGVQLEDDIELFSEDDKAIYKSTRRTLAVDNEVPAVGGRDGEGIEEIRQNALANFGAQNRAVTKRDYVIRTMAMPPKYGSIAKVYATADGSLDNNSPGSILSSPSTLNEFTEIVRGFTQREEPPKDEEIKTELKNFLVGKESNIKEKNNPFAVNLYILGYNDNGNLIQISDNVAVKENLKTYLNEYKMLTDGINILDGFIINIGIDFEIVVYRYYNKSEVLVECIEQLKEYFNVENWQFNQTINLSEIELLLANVEGVSSISELEIINKFGEGYSPNSYNIGEATRGKVIYPSLDPSVFEVRYPNKDIRGRVK